MRSKKYIIIVAVLIFIMALTLFIVNKIQKKERVKIELEQTDLDLVYGVNSAPIVIVMFTNYSCSFCKKFYTDVMPKLKAEYLDKGIVKLIVKPIIFNKNTLTSLKIVSCLAKYGNPEKINQLLYTQPSVIYTDEFNDMVNDFMHQDEFIGECMLSEGESEKYISKTYLQFVMLGFKGTPSFVINRKTIRGYMSFEKLQKIIEKKL